jgi:hypothetical protein
MRNVPPEDIAAEWRVFEEWGLGFVPAEIIAGSVSVITDDFPRKHFGMEIWERVQTLTFRRFEHDSRVSYEYKRRWMGDSYGEPVKTGETREQQ